MQEVYTVSEQVDIIMPVSYEETTGIDNGKAKRKKHRITKKSQRETGQGMKKEGKSEGWLTILCHTIDG